MLVAQNSLGPVCPVPLTVRGRHISAEVLVSLVASLSALMVVILGKRCRRMDWPRIRLPTAGRANRDDLLLDLESPLLLGDDYAPAPPASPPALLLPDAGTRGRRASSV